MVCVCLSAYWWSSCYSHRGLIVNNARLITKTLVRGFNVQSQTETKGGIGQRKSKGGSGGEVKLGEEEKRKRKRRLGSERWPSSARSRLQYWSTLWMQGSTCWVRGGGAQEGRSMQAEVQKRWKRCTVCVCVCSCVCVRVTRSSPGCIDWLSSTGNTLQITVLMSSVNLSCCISLSSTFLPSFFFCLIKRKSWPTNEKALFLQTARHLQ